MTTAAIEVIGLEKVYSSGLKKRKLQALGGIDFSVAPGEIFGLLGPNGAGKTTTVKILLGLTRATGGSAKLDGMSVSRPESRRRVGYLPEGHRFPGYLTARETLSLFGRMSGIDSATLNKRMVPLLEQLRIAEWIDVKVKKYSKGMTQRLGIASALIHDPAILLLDEPTDGVDPVGRREIRDILQQEARKGRAVLLNSHLLSEIELTCDRVAVVRKGKLAAIGTIDELTPRSESIFKVRLSQQDDAVLNSFRESGASVQLEQEHIRLGVRDIEHLNALIDHTRRAGILFSELTPIRSTLEDVFVDLVKMTDAEEARQEVTR